jgi:hypothetical protein
MSQTIYEGSPTRTERLKFRLVLDKGKAGKHKQSAKMLMGDQMPPTADDDKLTIDYQISIDYFDRIVGCLKAMRKILADPEVIVSVSTEELSHGTCLIQDVFTELAKVQEQLAARTT